MHNRVFDIFVGQMKIAPYGKTELVANFVQEFADDFANPITAVPIGLVRMWGRNNMCDTVVNGQTTHRQCGLPRLGAVIKARENVGVDVNHQ